LYFTKPYHVIFLQQGAETISHKADGSTVDCNCWHLVENWREKQMFCGFAPGLHTYSTEPQVPTRWHHREGNNFFTQTY